MHKSSFKHTIAIFICTFIISFNCQSESGQPYVDKFLSYLHWSQHLPTAPDPDFIAFIETSSPLTDKLRRNWLYQLAQQKDWSHFNQYYRDTTDINLQCYHALALYQLGQPEKALQDAIPLWLQGNSQPVSCNTLFDSLLSQHKFSRNLIEQRIALALSARNVSLARYLIKQMDPTNQQEIALLVNIYQKPIKILQLRPGPLHGEFYAFGLKQLIPRQMKLAIKIWNKPQAKIMMSEKQQQSFLVQLALYKAMRNEDDTLFWLSKIKRAYYTPNLLDWEIRYAIAHQYWQKVIYLIEQANDKDNPAWQYWLARAYEAQGNHSKAAKHYQEVAAIRNYYGFLASHKLKQTFHFENESVNTDLQTLVVYSPILNQIKQNYLAHQSWIASRLLNDFSSELPKEEKSALAYWVASDLHWYGKSVYLSNNETLNHQLALRFPLPYHQLIKQVSTHNQISQPLIYAMIRQESTFFEDIISTAGANGLMQLLPITAKVVAKRMNVAYSKPQELFIPDKNIVLGVGYLQQLSRQFNHHPILMVAAYNAGPKQVNYWLKKHAPRDIDIWIETLPWQETRNYLKNVIAFYAVYQYRLHEKPDLTIFMHPFFS